MIINGFNFTIYNAAEMTLSFMEKRCDIWEKCNASLVQNTLAAYANDIISYIDTLQIEDQTVTPLELFKFLEPLSLQITIQEMYTVVRYLSGSYQDKAVPTEILLSQFLDNLQALINQ